MTPEYTAPDGKGHKNHRNLPHPRCMRYTWVREQVAEFEDDGKKQISGLCAQNKNERLEQLPFFANFACRATNQSSFQKCT
jgi:hypothetical protein